MTEACVPDDELHFPLDTDELIALAGGLDLATRLRERVDGWRRETGSTARTHPRLEGTTFVVPVDCLDVAAACLAADEDHATYAGLVGRLRAGAAARGGR
ncbi:MAG: hypothetical protein U1E39_04870 [Planctomycetota bacterium]